MSVAVVGVTMTLPSPLEKMHTDNPGVFMKLLHRFQQHPREGVVMVYFSGGKLSHLRTEIIER